MVSFGVFFDSKLEIFSFTERGCILWKYKTETRGSTGMCFCKIDIPKIYPNSIGFKKNHDGTTLDLRQMSSQVSILYGKIYFYIIFVIDSSIVKSKFPLFFVLIIKTNTKTLTSFQITRTFLLHSPKKFLSGTFIWGEGGNVG